MQNASVDESTMVKLCWLIAISCDDSIAYHGPMKHRDVGASRASQWLASSIHPLFLHSHLCLHSLSLCLSRLPHSLVKFLSFSNSHSASRRGLVLSISLFLLPTLACSELGVAVMWFFCWPIGLYTTSCRGSHFGIKGLLRVVNCARADCRVSFDLGNVYGDTRDVNVDRLLLHVLYFYLSVSEGFASRFVYRKDVIPFIRERTL